MRLVGRHDDHLIMGAAERVGRLGRRIRPTSRSSTTW
jgi:hypothetical protein